MIKAFIVEQLLRIRPSTNVPTVAGELAVAASDSNKLKYHNGSTVEEIVQKPLLDAHIDDTTAAHAASAIANTPAGNVAATTVQAAIDELQTDIDTRATTAALDAHINDSADAHAGSAITNTPSGNLAATTVQGALNELQTDVDTRLTASSAAALTNKTFDADGTGNSISNIENADIKAAAAIDFSKLATLSSANILIGSAGNVATACAVTGDISLTNGGVTAYVGTVPLNKGGTGLAAGSANAAFNALSPMTTGGDLIYGGASGVATRLANGSAGQVLTSQGTTLAPTWTTVGGSQAYRSVTTTDAPTNTDYTLNCSGSSFTITLFTAVGNTGKVLVLKHSGTSLTQVYTLNTTGGQTIGGVASGSYALYTNGESLTIQSDGANWIILDHKAETSWIDGGAMTIGATTTPPTKGTTSRDKAWWRRDGQNVSVRFDYLQTGAGSAGSGNYLFTFPASLTIDTSIQTTSGTILGAATDDNANSWLGIGYIGAASSSNGEVNAMAYSSTQVWLYATVSFTARNPMSNSLYSLATAALGFNFTVSFPVSGWQP